MSIMTCLTSPSPTPLAALASANNDTKYLDIVAIESGRIHVKRLESCNEIVVIVVHAS